MLQFFFDQVLRLFSPFAAAEDGTPGQNLFQAPRYFFFFFLGFLQSFDCSNSF